jgi:hypothetical protein
MCLCGPVAHGEAKDGRSAMTERVTMRPVGGGIGSHRGLERPFSPVARCSDRLSIVVASFAQTDR